jgi:TRAP-type mannitol/chloroaromatic compound transport system substrate-binding protein
MKRRKFLKAALGSGAATAACTVAAPAISQGLREWRVAHAYPRNYPIFGTVANVIADAIAKGSNGRLTLKVFGAGEIVPPFETANAVSSNTVQMGMGTPYFWKGRVPAMALITALPFGLSGTEQNAWLSAGGRELCQKAYDRLGAKFFAAGNSGAQMGGWFNRSIDSAASFNGLKMRMPGMGGEVLKAMGCTIVNLPGGELLPALQSGTIDAAEWIGPYADLAFGFHKVAKYYYYPGWQEPSGIMDCFVNMGEWNKLPPDLKAVVEAAMEIGNAYVFNECNAKNAGALKTLVERHKVQLRRYSDETLVTLAQKSGEVINDLASQDPLSRELLDSILKFREDAIGYAKVSEQAMLVARSLDYRFAALKR